MNNTACETEKYPELQKKYKIIAFDWDGTAVHTRNDKIPEITAALEDLLKQGIYIVVITGTNFENINNQFSCNINGPHKRFLYICTNRGSEVFGFNGDSQPCLIFRKNIDEETNRLLDEIIEKTKNDIESKTKINLKIIYNRLNRRKLDLIPEWENPLKSEIGELIHETQKKLVNAGLKNGIKDAFDLMQENAELFKLKDARITSDVKHIEVGVSDKADSVKWILINLARPNNIPNSEILIIGDEFGPIAGFDGSDYKMVMKNEKEITYFSVGKEPNGLPEEVIHIGGGPECFLKIIKMQIYKL